MENYANFENFDYSAGINQAIGRLVASDNEVSLIVNGELEQIGPIHKTRGYEQRGDDVNDGYEILGNVAGIKSDGTQKQIVVADDAAESDAYTFNPINGAWTKHNLSEDGLLVRVDCFLLFQDISGPFLPGPGFLGNNFQSGKVKVCGIIQFPGRVNISENLCHALTGDTFAGLLKFGIAESPAQFPVISEVQEAHHIVQ